MGTDYLGNSVSSDVAAVLNGVNDFVFGFLAYETRIERVIAAAEAHPDAVLLNIYAGFVWMFIESPEGPGQARRHVEAAEQASRAQSLTARERGLLEVLRLWIADDLSQAIAVADRLSDAHPRDLATIKLQQYFEFNRGNSPAMLRAILKAAPIAEDVPHFHGMAAFAYEQCHRLAEAESAARQAVELHRKEPWAQHALAHVLLTQGRIEEGTEFLESVLDTWTSLNSFMHTHLWWHLAVFYLARGRYDEVLKLYDTQIWGISKAYSQDQIGAVQLLTRLEWAGVDVGERWSDLVDHIEQRGTDTVQPFLSLLYLVGLVRAGRPSAQALVEAIGVRGRTAASDERDTWARITEPVARGLLAYGQGDYAQAIEHLAGAVPQLVVIGGSHAQRDLFDLILLDAYIRAGRGLQAQQALELRRLADPLGVPVLDRLAVVYDALALPSLAEQIRREAHAARRDA